jgi:sporulation protein YlmC with PRC-barrel domain
MNTKTLLTAVSAAVLLASPAIAETRTTADAEANVEEGIERAKMNADKTWQDTKDAASDAKERVGNAAERAAAKTEAKATEVKARVFSTEATTTAGQTVTIANKDTASGMIGEPIVNGRDERVGTVHDLIIDADGKITTIVVADGGPLSMGDKLAAFDYGLVNGRDAEGHILMPLTEKAIKNVAEFSYDREKVSGERLVVIPTGAYSVKELIDADLVDQNNREVGDIENVVIKGDTAEQILAEVDDAKGLSGDKALFDFSDVSIVRDGDTADGQDDFNLQLGANTAAKLDAYRNK